MTVTPAMLISPKFASVTLTNEYAAQGKVLIDKLTATNVGAGAVQLTVHVVPPSGSPVAGNTVISRRAIAPNETFSASELAGHVLNGSNSLWMVTTAANSLVIYASGREIA